MHAVLLCVYRHDYGKFNMAKLSQSKTKWTQQSPLLKWGMIINTCSAKHKPSGNSLPGTVWLFTAWKPQAANTSMSYARAHKPHLREPIPACKLALPSSYYWHNTCRVNVKTLGSKTANKWYEHLNAFQQVCIHTCRKITNWISNEWKNINKGSI